MTRLLVFVLAVPLLAACSSEDRRSGDGGGSDGGGPSDAGAAPACPAEPPASGALCSDEGRRCAWVRCETEGAVTATCISEAWTVETSDCGDFTCDLGTGTTCTGSQICVARIGGAFLVDCQDNPCGTGAIEESCACEACAGAECTGVTGRTVSCNTCSEGPCP